MNYLKSGFDSLSKLHLLSSAPASKTSRFLQGPERHDPKLESLGVSSKVHPGHSAGTPGQNGSYRSVN
jgi:hypothetical protein